MRNFELNKHQLKLVVLSTSNDIMNFAKKIQKQYRPYSFFAWEHHQFIIFYFENVVLFHAKLGSKVCPRVDNQTSGGTLQELT